MAASKKKLGVAKTTRAGAAEQLEDLLERIGNLVSTDRRRLAAGNDLKDVQLRALSYLHQCNRYSDTPLALAEFLGLTKGTVSQTVTALENKGLVRKQKDEVDGRVVHLHVTHRGRAAVGESFPLPLLTRAADRLPDRTRDALTSSLRELLTALQKATGHASFGACHTCRHLQVDRDAYQCGLTDEPLLVAETQLICREHDSAAER